jgi:hypothetical protein
MSSACGREKREREKKKGRRTSKRMGAYLDRVF